MNLSENFTLREFTKSQTASRKNIDNTPSDTVVRNAFILAENVLQPVRDYFGTTIITSGYRSVELNRAIGGSDDSQHCSGQAADIEVPGTSTAELALWIQKNLDYDQLILEFYTPKDVNSGWVHVSYDCNGNRKEDLTAKVGADGNVQYEYGINP